MGDTAPEQKTDTGLQENVASALSYVLGFITGLIFFFIEKKSALVRFHAVQSIIVSVIMVVVSIVVSIISTVLIFTSTGLWGIATLLSSIVSLLSFAVYVALIVLAAMNKKINIPVVSGLAEKWSATKA